MSTIFPYIEHDAELRQALVEKEEIRFMPQPNGSTVCSYIISAQGTFDTKWAREARGITFDANGKVISRPLHKFFNVNEREETLAANVNWHDVRRVMVKRDGSMIHTVAQQNADPLWPSDWNFDLKSKKSYTSDVAHGAKAHMMFAAEAGLRYHEFCNWCIANDLTAIFEWTSPRARIVVYYPEDGLKLLHIRHNKTGLYFDEDELISAAVAFDIPVVEAALYPDGEPIQCSFNINKLIEIAETLEGTEGWVIQFNNGNMVKLKTKWYCERHRAMTFLRERDIAVLVMNEELDDLKSILVGEGADITEVLEIEARVVQVIDGLISFVESIVEQNKHLDRKTFALKLKDAGVLHFKLIMDKYSGKEPNYKDYFEKNMLKELFSLRQLNIMQSVAELE